MAGGEIISDLGSTLTLFAIDYWVYERTQSVTLFASVSLFSSLPAMLMAPFAGAWIDRINRRRAMIACNAGLALLTGALAALTATGGLTTLVLCIFAPLFAALGAFLSLAFAAAAAQLVPPDQIPRVAGVIGTVHSIGSVGIRLAAGFLLLAIRLHGVLLVDFASTLVAIGTAAAVALPDPPPIERGGEEASILRDTLEGWRFVRGRAGLLGMLSLFALVEFVARMSTLLSTPLVLSIASAAALGVIRSVAVAGVLCGSVLLGVFGGSRARKMPIILACCALNGVCVFLAGLHVSMVGLSIFVFGCGFFEPIVGALGGAVWQAKIPTQMLGRVYAVRTAVQSAVLPIVVLLSGPLSDRVFEPAMQPGGALAPTLGRFLGTGPGRGVGAILVLLGVFEVAMVLFASRNRHLRCVETELPDAQA
ncbi:MAG TPA: MFS transporter [Polyangiaceae bacterium]